MVCKSQPILPQPRHCGDDPYRGRAGWPPRRLEQAMLEAYQADGWRGANRERFKPTADLDRARRQGGGQCFPPG